MLRSFLVSLDESDFDEKILPYASALARSANVALHLAHVHVPYPQLLPTDYYGWEGVGMRKPDDRDRKKEWDYLDETPAEEVVQQISNSIATAVEEGLLPDNAEAFIGAVAEPQAIVLKGRKVRIRGQHPV